MFLLLAALAGAGLLAFCLSRKASPLLAGLKPDMVRVLLGEQKRGATRADVAKDPSALIYKVIGDIPEASLLAGAPADPSVPATLLAELRGQFPKDGKDRAIVILDGKGHVRGFATDPPGAQIMLPAGASFFPAGI